jgi:hypothetical protein
MTKKEFDKRISFCADYYSDLKDEEIELLDSVHERFYKSFDSYKGEVSWPDTTILYTMFGKENINRINRIYRRLKTKLELKESD